jgi:hypothetical protein
VGFAPLPSDEATTLLSNLRVYLCSKLEEAGLCSKLA